MTITHDSGFVRQQMHIGAVTLIMALQYVETRRGAERIYTAECRGLKRPHVLTAAIRRLDDFTRPYVPTAAKLKENTRCL